MITGTTRLLGLFGSPVKHSMSPAMYNYCFKKWKIDWRYLAFSISREDTEEAIKAFRVLRMRGANITMPCKQAVIPYLDWVSPAVKLSGACNTIVNDNGFLKGYITDGEGYVMNLQSHGMDIQGKRITILGAGGAATAIQVQVLLDGAAEINVFNKKDGFWNLAEEKIQKLQDSFPNQRISLYDLDNQELLQEKIQKSDVLTNATRVGMAPLKDVSLIQDTSVFGERLLVTDCVYNPIKTKLLAAAEESGSQIADGLGMLIYQGAAAAKLYTGMDMPVDEIKEHFFKSES